jgi:hypothetical protein
MATTFATQAISITATTLASGSARESGSVTTDTTNNVDDYRITVKATAAAGTPTGSKAVFVWVKTSDDSGTTWDGNATSSDAAITLDSPHQFYFGVAIPFPTSTLTRAGSFSLKAACGGSLPKTWGIIIENQIGFAFTACSVTCMESYNT